MPLAHPFAVEDAPYPYFGLRAFERSTNAPGSRPRRRLSAGELRANVGRAEPTWRAWERAWAQDLGQPVRTKGPVAPMPRYLSAYMALVDGAHPGLEVWFARDAVSNLGWPLLGGVGAPPSQAEWNVWRREHGRQGLSDEEIAAAFCYVPSLNKQESVATLWRDPVRWHLVRMLADAHPHFKLVPRTQGHAPWVTPVRATPTLDQLSPPPGALVGRADFRRGARG
jgi:hypothetical protein